LNGARRGRYRTGSRALSCRRRRSLQPKHTACNARSSRPPPPLRRCPSMLLTAVAVPNPNPITFAGSAPWVPSSPKSNLQAQAAASASLTPRAAAQKVSATFLQPYRLSLRAVCADVFVACGVTGSERCAARFCSTAVLSAGHPLAHAVRHRLQHFTVIPIDRNPHLPAMCSAGFRALL
jgi:hypothetical protein